MLALTACGLPREVHAYSGDKPWKEHCADVARAVTAVVPEASRRSDGNFLRTVTYRTFNRVSEGREHVTTRLLFEYAQIRYGIMKTAYQTSIDVFNTCVEIDRL
jgi:hypothetical protein